MSIDPTPPPARADPPGRAWVEVTAVEPTLESTSDRVDRIRVLNMAIEGHEHAVRSANRTINIDRWDRARLMFEELQETGKSARQLAHRGRHVEDHRRRGLPHVGRVQVADRAALIGRLYARPDAEWLAELLMDLEGEDGEPVRLQLAESLRVLGWLRLRAPRLAPRLGSLPRGGSR